MLPLKKLAPLVFLAVLLPSFAGATTFVRVSDADLADQAPVIAEVVVASSDYSLTPKMPVTDYRVEVRRVLRGDLPGSGVVVRVHGGKKAGGMELKIYGAPSFKAGDRALLFLRPAADGTYRILHVFQGAFRVLENDGVAYVLRDFGAADELEIAGREIAAERPRNLESFAGWIADRAAGQARPADYFVDAAPLLSSIAQKFTLLDRNGVNMRWDAFDASQNVTFLAHSAGQPGRPGGGFGDLQTAINAWNDDGPTNIRYRYGGTTTLTAGFLDYDGENVVLWDDLDDAGDFEQPFSCATGGTIAIGGPWFDSQQRHIFHGQQFITIQGADIVTNDGLECWINLARRLEEVLAHELGHTLGLGHSCGDSDSGPCDTNAKNDALMRANAHGDSRGARLQSDDQAAINILYGSGVNPTPPAAPSGLSATALGGATVSLGWTDNSNDETHFLVERKTGNESFQEIHSTGAGVTSYSDAAVISGTSYIYRVRAINDAGSSAYSNQASATVQGEKAPTNLAALTTSPTAVRLTWLDNSASENGFDVEAKLGAAPFTVVAATPPNTQLVIVTGLFADSDYTFRVRARGGLGFSNYSNEAVATTAPAPIEPCVRSATRTCLNGERFQVEVRWKDFGGLQGSGEVVPFGSADSGLFFFFSAGNWEMLIKVLNGCSINNNFWVYAAATTNVEYTLFVTDTHTGRTQSYYNPLGNNAAAITDGAAFATCTFPLDGGESSVASSPVRSAQSALVERLQANPTSDLGAIVPEATCADTATQLCLQNERFKVEVTWTDFQAVSGPGKVVPAGTADSGLFFFFSPDNWELLVKVLDGCGINNRIWVLAAATTDVAYTLKVTDMNDPANPRTYTNPLGVASPAVIDIQAFAACN